MRIVSVAPAGHGSAFGRSRDARARGLQEEAPPCRAGGVGPARGSSPRGTRRTAARRGGAGAPAARRTRTVASVPLFGPEGAVAVHDPRFPTVVSCMSAGDRVSRQPVVGGVGAAWSTSRSSATAIQRGPSLHGLTRRWRSPALARRRRAALTKRVVPQGCGTPLGANGGSGRQRARELVFVGQARASARASTCCSRRCVLVSGHDVALTLVGPRQRPRASGLTYRERCGDAPPTSPSGSFEGSVSDARLYELLAGADCSSAAVALRVARDRPRRGDDVRATGTTEFTRGILPKDVGYCLVKEAGTVTNAGARTVAGEDVVVLTDKGDKPGTSPGELYLPASGPALPTRLRQTGPEGRWHARPPLRGRRRGQHQRLRRAPQRLRQAGRDRGAEGRARPSGPAAGRHPGRGVDRVERLSARRACAPTPRRWRRGARSAGAAGGRRSP